MLTARPYQTEAVDAVFERLIRADEPSTLVILPTGCGKCLGRGTPVLMYDGTTKAVESVGVGDLLMGPDSLPRRVVSLARGRERMYRVHPTKGDSYTVNESHILSLKLTPEDAGQERELINLSVREYLTRSMTFRHRAKGWRAAVDWSERETPLDPYWVGVWLGDGTAAKPAVSKPDAEILASCEEVARQNGCVVRVEQSEGTCPVYHLKRADGESGRFRPNPIRLKLQSLGLMPAKFVPQLYKCNSRRVRLEVLAGVLDTDGHNTGSGFDYISVSEQLACDVAFLARSLGLAAYVSRCVKGIKKAGFQGTYYRVSISGDCSVIPNRIPRKRAAVRSIKKDALVTGITLERLEVDDYFGFEIEGPDRLFLLGDFTVTHNTVVFGLVSRRWSRDHTPGTSGRVLVLAHRDELISQAADELEPIVGRRPDIEQAERVAFPAAGSVDASPVVVGSVQTLCSEKRLSRWPKDEFGLIVTDEAHHATANSYRRIYSHFSGAKLLGVTATPKRADDLALGSVFGSVAYEMGIEDAVQGGWLCPVEQRFVTVRGMDLSKLHTDGDDFRKSELSAVLSGDHVLDQMVAATVELCGDEPTLIFTAPKQPGSDCGQGELFADALNKIKPGKAVFLSGETARDIRRRELEWFEQGRRQYLVGCSLFTEGFNVPKISRVVMARLTKSVVYYTQAIGRGTRTLRGVLRPDHETPDQRRAAIAASAKPSVLVIDFVGNSGRHKLVSAVDIFAGKHPDEVVARAKKLAEKKAKPVRELLDEAAELERKERLRKEAERQRQRERASVRVNGVDLHQESVDPFGASDGVVARPVGATRPGGATQTQLEWIRSHGGIVSDDATASEAGRIIDDMKRRWNAGHCSPKQERTLKRAGLCDGPIPKAHAKALIDWLAASNWRVSGKPSRSMLAIQPVGNGFQLAIGGVKVGGVYASPAQVRAVYEGLAPREAVSA